MRAKYHICDYVHVCPFLSLPVSSVQSPSCVQLFATPWTAANQASQSITNSWSLLKLMSFAWEAPAREARPWELSVGGERGRGLAVYKCIRRNFKTLLSLAIERLCSFYFQKQTPASAFPGNFAFCLNLLHFASCESERNTRCDTSRCKRKPTRWMVLAVTRHCSLLPLGYV